MTIYTKKIVIWKTYKHTIIYKYNLIHNMKLNNINQESQFVLTESQSNVYDELLKFVSTSDPKIKEMLLVGYAGTGKTTLVAKFINDLVEKKICKKIVMVAPTHKAVNIAKSKLFGNVSAGPELAKTINIMTIHRLLNYQSYVGQEGEKFFAKGKVDPNWSIYDLVVVDECSMLSNQIIGDIKEQILKEKNPNTKVLYVGDPAQLPPVNQAESKIFNGSIPTLSLDKIIRTSNLSIVDLSNSHRKWIFSKNIDDIPHIGEYESDSVSIYSTQEHQTKNWLDDFVSILKSNGKKIISEFDNGLNITNSNSNSNSNSDTNSELEPNLMLNHDVMINNHNNNIILTWTNKKSNLYNQYVREKIFGKKNLSQWEIGEILIFNDFHKREYLKDIEFNDLNDKTNKINKTNKIETDIPDELMPKEQVQVSFYTSEQVKLVGIIQKKYKPEHLLFKKNNNLTPELNDKFKKYYHQINLMGDVTFDIYEMQVQKIVDLMNDENIQIPTYTILSLNPESEKKLGDICDGIEVIIAKLKSKCYTIINKLKDDNMTKCNYQSEVEKKINRLYKEYQTNLIDCFAQLNYGYCITVHKSQGSTFKNVFVDMNDILNNNNQNETSKCLYTSITRSSNSLKLLV